jgi:ABC-type amino acid transport system permease subunit
MIPYVLATSVLWTLSAALAVTIGLILAAASVGSRAGARLLAEAAITVTRGVPTSLLVVAAGIITIRISPPGWMPNPFPRTPSSLRLLAWAVVAALALGSAGHLAVIFRTAYAALGSYRIQQTTVLGIRPWSRLALLAREAAATALPPTGTRLVHHLHNTAFATLFPIADLFGWVQEQANATFDVSRYALIGAGVYIALSGLIWSAFRTLELRMLLDPTRALRRALQPPVSTR